MRFVSFIIASLVLAYSSTLVSAGLSNSDNCKMLQLVNNARAKAGKGALKLSKALCASAQAHSDYMSSINSMTHDDPRGGLGSRIMSSGFPSWSCVSENIASGQTSVDDVVGDWINSPGHYANIISNSIYAGFGRAGNMWTQQFASPANLSYNDDYDICGAGGNDNQPAQQPDNHGQDYYTTSIENNDNDAGYLVHTYVNGHLLNNGIYETVTETETVTQTIVHNIYHN